MRLQSRCLAEVVGTFWLVFAGCGSALFAAATSGVGIGWLGVSLAYALGHLSGCHLNPAVSVGRTASGRYPARELPAYIAAQLFGATAGAGGGLLAAGIHRLFAAEPPAAERVRRDRRAA